MRTSGVRPLALLLAASDKGDPLMASMEVGEGKVVSLAVDTTYHWAFNSRRGRDDTFPCFERFWRRLVLYLAGKSHGEGFSVEIRAASALLSPGESVPFEVTVTDERGRPVRDAKVEVEMESASGARTALPLTAGRADLRLEAGQVLALLYLGLIASGLCFFLWNSGAKRTSAGVLSVMNNLKIPLAVACSLLFFGEEGNIPALIGGGAVILAALLLGRTAERRAAGRKRSPA